MSPSLALFRGQLWAFANIWRIYFRDCFISVCLDVGSAPSDHEITREVSTAHVIGTDRAIRV